ncbi:MAG: divergent polysaccharide deacetylase family protein, partial [Candidatus Omnitrophica bacterium]|nr:divergent polysaccharide deacetylase family protein [Candidatus Omnitrophota bacterium]
MVKKRLSDSSPFFPLALFIILCILITVVGIIREVKKEKVPVSVPPAVKKEKPSVIEKAIPPSRKEKVQIGIIIDDLGWNKEIAKEIEKINRPIAVSILPYAPYSIEVFNEFKRNDAIEILLHLPLEPRPPVQSLDKGVIKTEMSNEEINRQFYEALKNFYPGVKGVNNHQGSLFTSDEEKMRILLGAIQSKNLFFVDSMTARQSKGYILAKEMGIKTAKRDIFLDNKSDPEYIEGQIRELVGTAKKEGKAIGIGHARRTTIEVLKNILPAARGWRGILKGKTRASPVPIAA